jgi:hypothetical protein
MLSHDVHAPHRPVQVTATFFSTRPRSIYRWQHLRWSDPKVHRAPKTRRYECEWKHGEWVRVAADASRVGA